MSHRKAGKRAQPRGRTKKSAGKKSAGKRSAGKKSIRKASISSAIAKKPPQAVGRVLYLYGIARSGQQSPPHAPGVDGVVSVEAVSSSGLTCWISRVDAHEFGDELERNIENLDWLAEASVRHQRVVAELSARDTVLPARFGTVFISEKTLFADVAGRKKDLQAALRRLAGTEEWGVKVFQSEPERPTVAAESGRDYLRQKAAILKPAAPAQLSVEVKEFAQALAKVAADAVPGGKLSGGQRGLEWQASFLVRRNDRKQWDEVLGRYARRWGAERRIECTGPWPPYSFVSERG
ncbi:MAG: GvpL/GvpF family gas vesicle protein [Acidobacteriota bacterium]|nr:GvpL/GvpF family gas vesicle protein [Acidobacteriota bacterium]